MTIKGVVIAYTIIIMYILLRMIIRGRWEALEAGKTKVDKVDVFANWIVRVVMVTLIIVVIAFIVWTVYMSYTTGEIEPYLYPYLTYFVSFTIFISVIIWVGR